MEKKHKDLIEKLISSTLSKKISWERSKRESEFRVKLGPNTVTTDNWTLFETGARCVDLGIWNQQEVLVDHIAFEDNDAERADYAELFRLYSAAKDSFFKVDDTISDIMAFLD